MGWDKGEGGWFDKLTTNHPGYLDSVRPEPVEGAPPRAAQALSAASPALNLNPAIGGIIFHLGAWIMLYNVVMTVRRASAARATNAVPAKA